VKSHCACDQLLGSRADESGGFQQAPVEESCKKKETFKQKGWIAPEGEGYTSIKPA
jgi:hypothetical protein